MQKKTYLDEEGFMVTKMEMGSCSEDSNDKPPVKESQVNIMKINIITVMLYQCYEVCLEAAIKVLLF